MRGARQAKGYPGKRRPGWLKALFALILAGAASFGALFGAVMYGAYDHVSGDPQVMVVLGCQVKPEGPSVLLRDRLDKALAYLKDHPDMTVVVSGGQGSNEPTTEARAMADYLVEHGVPREQILQEGRSRNTLQNLKFSQALLEEHGIDYRDGVLIVSNGFHLTRARMLAQRLGYGPVSTLAAPSSDVLSRLRMYVREPLALVKSFVFDR